MFGLGMPEILLILAIALMVIGPKKLPELAKTLGRAMGEFKKAAQDFKRSIDMEDTVKRFEEPSRSIKETIDEIKAPLGTSKTDDIDKERTLDQDQPAENPSNGSDLTPPVDKVKGADKPVPPATVEKPLPESEPEKLNTNTPIKENKNSGTEK